MKKIAMLIAIFIMAIGAKAQDCEAIMLPYFKGNVERMEQYRDNAYPKFMARCAYAHAAFYESDTIPEGVELFSIAEVREVATGNPLPESFVIDLNTLSYYAYSFSVFQVRNNSIFDGACFSTPGSSHPYLVLRSMNEMQMASRRAFDEYIGNQ